MTRIKILFAALLVVISVSQVEATGFAPNMFVAQKQLNHTASKSTVPQKETAKSSETIESKKESNTQKERSKESFKFSGKKFTTEFSDQDSQFIEVDSIVSSLCKTLLTWVVSSIVSATSSI